MTAQPGDMSAVARAGRAPALMVAGGVLLGAVVRVLLALGREYPSYDGAYYLALARDLAAFGRLPYSTFPPGFPGLVALVLLGLGTDVPIAPLRAAQAVNVLCGSVQGGLAFAFARRRLPPWPAAAVALLTLMLPLQLTLSAGDLSEPSFGCLLLAGALLLENQRALAAGLAWGAAYLVRPEALLVGGAFALIEGVRTRRPPWRLLAGCALAVVPYTLYVHQTTGRWLLSSKAVFLEQSIEQHPGAALLPHALGNLTTLLRELSQQTGLPLAISALVCGVVAGGRWMALSVPVLALPLFSFRMEDRYWAPYLPVVLTAAWLAVPLAGEATAASRRRWVLGGLAALMLAGAVVAAVPPARRLRAESESYPGQRAAGLWLRNRVPRGTIVVSRKPYTSFWAWCRFARVPDGVAASRVVAWARDNGAQWLEVDVHTAVTLAPELLPLLEDVPEHLKGQLVLEHTFHVDGRPEQTTYLYRIVAPDARLAPQQEAVRP